MVTGLTLARELVKQMQTSGNFIVGIIGVNTDPLAFLFFSAGVCDESSKAAHSQIALSRQLETD